MNLVVRAAEAQDRARWDTFVLAHPESHFGQRFIWGVVTERSYGCRLRYWVAEQAGRVVGVLPLFRGRDRLFSAPGGVLALDDTVAAALIDHASEEVHRDRLLWLELRDQRRRVPGLETNDEHVTMVLDLAEHAEAQWQAFDAKLRNQIRKSAQAGFEHRWGHEQLADFHRVMLENMRDLGTPMRAPGYFARTLQAFGAAAQLQVIALGGEAVGTMFTVVHGDALCNPWASSLRRFFKHNPNSALYWAALKQAFASGQRRFDFGRSQRGSNTFRFKAQWGARPVPLFYQYRLGSARHVPTLAAQRGSFDLAVRLWQRLPLPLAGWLGEPVKRMFPEVL